MGLWALQSIFCYWSSKPKICQIFPDGSCILSSSSILHNGSRKPLVSVNPLQTWSPCKNCWISCAVFRVDCSGGIKYDPRLLFSKDKNFKQKTALTL